MVMVAPATASAGRTFYGWLQSTEVMPERGAEISTFVSEENYQGDANNRDTTWWIGPSIGINDQLELTLPVEFAWDRADGSPPRSVFANYGAEIKYRFVTTDPVDKPDFAPAVRIAMKRIVTGPRDVWHPELNVIGSYETGIVHGVVDLGVTGDIGPSSHHFEFHPGAGASIETVADLRVGAEVFASITLDDNGDGSWAAVGPNIAWSHGRSWLSASYGIGIYKIRDAPKFNWGIAF
jgi:hypothetical protein